MKFKPALLSVAAALTLFAGSAQAVQTFSLTGYSVSYDETTPFGFVSFSTGSAGSEGFGWNLNGGISAVATGGSSVSTVYALPSFTVTVNPGYVLTGSVSGFLGNLVYTLFGADAAVSAQVSGSVAVDGGPALALSGTLTDTVISSGVVSTGYLSGNDSANLGSFSSLSFSGGSLTLSASGGVLAAVTGQPQNVLQVDVGVAPIPEPGTWALMLGGVALLGGWSRRLASR